jgi:hypothetical protein
LFIPEELGSNDLKMRLLLNVLTFHYFKVEARAIKRRQNLFKIAEILKWVSALSNPRHTMPDL